jgi:hypothetical protein
VKALTKSYSDLLVFDSSIQFSPKTKAPKIMKGFNESTYQPLNKCIVSGGCGYVKDWSEEHREKQDTMV